MINDQRERDRLPMAIDPEKKAKKPWQAWLTGSPVLFISIVIHIVFLSLALFFVVQKIQEKKKTFKSVAVAPAVQKLERQVQLTKMNQAQSSPEMTEKIVTNEVSNVNLPAVEFPSDDPGEGSAKMGAATLGGAGNTTGIGGGTPMDLDISTLATVFGIENGIGEGLTGHFYDLKQTSSRGPTGMDVNKYAEVVAEFMNTGWRSNFFSNYFVGPKPLYLPQVFTPYMVASQGPEAFKVQDYVQPRLWVVLYHGYVKAHKAGTYRFVGFGDDLCEVAINKKTVLDGAWRGIESEKINHPPTGTYSYTYKCGLPGRDVFTTDFMCGDWFTVDEDQKIEMDVLVGERPGGYCGFWLFIEDKDRTYEKTPKGSPILPVFRLSDVKMPPTDVGCPPHAPNGDVVWSVVDENGDSLSN